MKRLLLLGLLAAALAIPGAASAATTSTYTVSATSSRAAIVTWTTSSAGDMTMTLRYASKGGVAFNVWATSDGASLNGLCATTTGPGWITYTCTDAPASGYEAMIWPSKGSLSGTLTVTS